VTVTEEENPVPSPIEVSAPPAPAAKPASPPPVPQQSPQSDEAAPKRKRTRRRRKRTIPRPDSTEAVAAIPRPAEDFHEITAEGVIHLKK
jgi:hypothetical protein